MTIHDLTPHLYLTPEEVAALFRKDTPWVYRQRNKLLKTAARSFGKRHLLFDKKEVYQILQCPPE